MAANGNDEFIENLTVHLEQLLSIVKNRLMMLIQRLMHSSNLNLLGLKICRNTGLSVSVSR